MFPRPYDISPEAEDNSGGQVVVSARRWYAWVFLFGIGTFQSLALFVKFKSRKVTIYLELYSAAKAQNVPVQPGMLSLFILTSGRC